jgi:DNA-binding winged helix-turn-helix (wHTH) protein
MAQVHYIAFGPFRLETPEGRLWRGDQVLALRPRSLAMLRYLVAHPGRLVTKVEVQQHVWAGTHVTPNVLPVCVREIRATLGDAARAPQYLATVSRQGYRWQLALRLNLGELLIWFTEGFDTVDLQEAEAFLDTL